MKHSLLVLIIGALALAGCSSTTAQAGKCVGSDCAPQDLEQHMPPRCTSDVPDVQCTGWRTATGTLSAHIDSQLADQAWFSGLSVTHRNTTANCTQPRIAPRANATIVCEISSLRESNTKQHLTITGQLHTNDSVRPVSLDVRAAVPSEYAQSS